MDRITFDEPDIYELFETFNCDIANLNPDEAMKYAIDATLRLKKQWQDEARIAQHYKTKYDILDKISHLNLRVSREAFSNDYTCNIMPHISKLIADKLSNDNNTYMEGFMAGRAAEANKEILIRYA